MIHFTRNGSWITSYASSMIARTSASRSWEAFPILPLLLLLSLFLLLFRLVPSSVLSSALALGNS